MKNPLPYLAQGDGRFHGSAIFIKRPDSAVLVPVSLVTVLLIISLASVLGYTVISVTFIFAYRAVMTIMINCNMLYTYATAKN
jgi:hypothetical protein